MISNDIIRIAVFENNQHLLRSLIRFLFCTTLPIIIVCSYSIGISPCDNVYPNLTPLQNCSGNINIIVLYFEIIL